MPHAPASSRTLGAPATPDPAVPAAPGRRATYRQVLGAGEFRAIFAANIVSMLGTVVAAVALTVLVYQRTGSPALAALVMALAFLPYLPGGLLLPRQPTGSPPAPSWSGATWPARPWSGPW